MKHRQDEMFMSYVLKLEIAGWLFMLIVIGCLVFV